MQAYCSIRGRAFICGYFVRDTHESKAKGIPLLISKCKRNGTNQPAYKRRVFVWQKPLKKLIAYGNLSHYEKAVAI
jgi:hypothetical protein